MCHRFPRTDVMSKIVLQGVSFNKCILNIEKSRTEENNHGRSIYVSSQSGNILCFDKLSHNTLKPNNRFLFSSSSISEYLRDRNMFRGEKLVIHLYYRTIKLTLATIQDIPGTFCKNMNERSGYIKDILYHIFCNVPVVIDTSILDPLKEYIKDKKKGINPTTPTFCNVPAGDGYQQYLFQYCLDLMKQDKLLKAVDRSLQLGLSGIINTVSTDKTINITDHFGKKKFRDLANMLKIEGMSKECTGDPVSDAVVKSVLSKYKDGGIIGTRSYIYKQKLELLEHGEYIANSPALKIYDIFGYLYSYVIVIFRFDMIQFDFDNKYKYAMTENESFARWHGEVVSQATRSEMVDPLATVSSGRKIDMLVMTQSEDEEEKCVELSANEHKKGNAEFDVVNEQQAKNIVTNVCIMSQLRKRFDVDIGVGSNTNPLIIDVIGLRGYLYSVARTQDVFVTSKVSNDYIVLQTTFAELDEFIKQGSIYLLLNYSKYIITAANEIVTLTDKTTKRRFQAIMNDQVDHESPKIFFSENKKQKAT
ncbi:hypothetical protein BDC45DRAFT_535786 [Circinella umbellata]|nr:hypothetical protein BDC45DRAFT_535786 [Circinella umbellata]